MNIFKMQSGFTDIVDVGRFAYFVTTDKTGAYVPNDDIYEKCQYYSRVVFRGDDPLLQKEDLSKICKKLAKSNSNITIEIHTDGLIKPSDTGYAGNAVYNVFVALKSSGVPYEKRVTNVLNWFVDAGANFIFVIQSIDEIDEVVTIANNYSIKKSQIFLTPVTNLLGLEKHVKLVGYNIAPNVEWEENGI